ncbi:hypothetical protein BCR34DRAFT_306289 [Clohesyomyces aquaticus]|uniref:Uncharacterized protein n=1 Tax=Clohesyomyces aquaticus TaxID=1231657 RepID=A0A1Y1ZPR0_9PLEO|nr:hypothetical protein BCR34DRAFT_306289 [Clohesyomyces aquaticus]
MTEAQRYDVMVPALFPVAKLTFPSLLESLKYLAAFVDYLENIRGNPMAPVGAETIDAIHRAALRDFNFIPWEAFFVKLLDCVTPQDVQRAFWRAIIDIRAARQFTMPEPDPERQSQATNALGYFDRLPIEGPGWQLSINAGIVSTCQSHSAGQNGVSTASGNGAAQKRPFD